MTTFLQPSAAEALGTSMTPDATKTLDAWGHFFGPTAPQERPILGGGMQYQHHNLPADRTLHNGYLGTLVYGLVLDSMPEILMRILPPRRIETLDVTFDVIAFNTPMATVVPYETAGRLVTHSFSKGGAQLTRRGVGMLLDTETLNTAFGLNMFNAQVQQLNNVVHLTLLGDAMWALLNAATLPQQGQPSVRDRFLAQRGLTSRAIEDLIEYEILSYATISKNPVRGAENVFKDLKQYAANNQFQFNAILCGQEMMSYAVKAGAPSDYLFEAYGAREYRPGLEGGSTIADIPVYTIPALNVYQDTAEIPDLDSHVQIGEFYLAVDPIESGRKKNGHRRKEERAVMLYNENTDAWERIDLVDMIENCLRWDQHGDLNGVHDKLAGDPQAMDVFLTKDGSHNVKVEVYGEIENQYLSYETLDAVARSLVSGLDDEARSAVNTLFETYEGLLRGSPDAKAYTPTGPNYDDVNIRAKHLGFYVGKSDFYSVDDLRAKIHTLKPLEIQKAGFLANWYGLELMAAGDHNVRKGVEAFIQLYTELKIKLGDDHPFVDEGRCPVYLREYVQHKGACTLFETVFGYSTSPIVAFIDKTATFPTGGQAIWTEADIERLIMNADRLTINAQVNEKFVKYVEKVVNIIAHDKEAYDELNAKNRHAQPSIQEFQYTFFSEVDTQAQVSQAALKEFVEKLDSTRLDAYLQAKNAEEKAAAFVKLGLEGYKYAAPVERATDVASKTSQMLLPLVISSKFTGPFFQSFSQNALGLPGFSFGTFSPQDEFLAVISPTDDEFTDKIGRLRSQLNSTKAYMHRIARMDDKFFPQEQIEAAQFEKFEHPTERIRGQREVQSVKRNKFDASDVQYVGVPPPSTKVYTRQLPAFAARYRQLALTSDAALRAAMFAFIVTPVNVFTLKNLAINDCVVPFNFLLLRLTDVHVMGGALAVQGGPELGGTFFGLDNWTAGVSPETKLFFANYTFHTKALVLRPERVVFVPGLQYKGYCGGHNCTFMTWDEVVEWNGKGWLASQEDCDNEHRDRASLLCFLIPYTERKMPKFIDASGWLPRQDKSKVDPAYSTAPYYNMVCGFERVFHEKTPGYSLLHRERKPNLLAVHGPVRAYTADGDFSHSGPFSQSGKGHHGLWPEPGYTARVRAGMAVAEYRTPQIAVRA